jgi:hypothetical protein
VVLNKISGFYGGEGSSLVVTLKMKAAWTSETFCILPQHYTASQPRRPRLEAMNKFMFHLATNREKSCPHLLTFMSKEVIKSVSLQEGL